MEGTIRVAPEKLAATAEEFSSQGNAVRALTEQMMGIVTNLCSAWEGEASTAYITKFKGLEDDMGRLIGMITEHSTDLQEMARVYTEGEQKNAEIANSLSDQIIS